MERIRVGAFDEAPLFRAGIAHVLNADPGMEVVAEGGSASEALRLSKELVPDVVILDAAFLKESPGLARSIAAVAGVRLLISSHRIGASEAREIFAAGAKGYVFKGVVEHDLREAVRTVHRGQGYISPALAAEMMMSQAALEEAKHPSRHHRLAQLTHREEQIFALLCAGLKNQEIGARLNVAERTVKHYVTHIFEILNVRNRVEAAALAEQRGPLEQARSSEPPQLPKEVLFPDGPPPNRGLRSGLHNLSPAVYPAMHYTSCDSAADFTLSPASASGAQCFAAVFGSPSISADDAYGEPAVVHVDPASAHVILPPPRRRI